MTTSTPSWAPSAPTAPTATPTEQTLRLYATTLIPHVAGQKYCRAGDERAWIYRKVLRQVLQLEALHGRNPLSAPNERRLVELTVWELLDALREGPVSPTGREVEKAYFEGADEASRRRWRRVVCSSTGAYCQGQGDMYLSPLEYADSLAEFPTTTSSVVRSLTDHSAPKRAARFDLPCIGFDPLSDPLSEAELDEILAETAPGHQHLHYRFGTSR